MLQHSLIRFHSKVVALHEEQYQYPGRFSCIVQLPHLGHFFPLAIYTGDSFLINTEHTP